MPVLEQFKNFIRHGKAAREAPEGLTNDPAGRRPLNPSPARNRHTTSRLCPERQGFARPRRHPPTPHAAPSTAAVAASTTSTTAAPSTSTSNQHQSDQARDMRQSSNGNHLAPSPAAGSSKGDQYQREAERIVAEEREASEKMPYYEGLSERFQLIKKMGDGAFSNVGAPLHFRFSPSARGVVLSRAFSAPFPSVVPSFRRSVVPLWCFVVACGPFRFVLTRAACMGNLACFPPAPAALKLAAQNASGQGASDRQQDACHPLSALGRLPSSVHFFPFATARAWSARYRRQADDPRPTAASSKLGCSLCLDLRIKGQLGPC
ncbi:hypothetical protein L1887_61822 [Cichorium endivia]|nr:hypothetical protein L1887_61822 [Cichorium endivia]